MDTIDPATGQPLPAEAIQRILFIGSAVHVYDIPPLASVKGYTAAGWTDDPRRHIFTCRLRVIETAGAGGGGGGGDGGEEREEVRVAIVLEDPATGQLFAAAPYRAAATVEPALDSSRFFALRVQDGAGRRATLGIGFEERSDAFDFGVALQEAQKALGLLARDDAAASGSAHPPSAAAATAAAAAADAHADRDYSLKEGETITVNLGGRRLGRRAPPQGQQLSSLGGGGTGLPGPAIPPPPSAGDSRAGGFLPPPPGTPGARAAKRQSLNLSALNFSAPPQKKAEDLGFDDGQFGEFA